MYFQVVYVELSQFLFDQCLDQNSRDEEPKYVEFSSPNILHISLAEDAHADRQICVTESVFELQGTCMLQTKENFSEKVLYSFLALPTLVQPCERSERHTR